MNERGKIGIGELLFGLVIILGIIGTVSFFAFEEVLGEYQTTFMIVSSLAFIVSFFALSVYARAKKRSHFRRMNLDRALDHWFAYAASSGTAQKSLPAGTLDSLATHALTSDGYHAAPAGPKKADGILRFLNKDGQLELVQTRQDQQPIGLREVVSFYEVLRGEKAVRGEIWSPGGFTADALNWVQKKPVALLDTDAIHQNAEYLADQKRNAVSRAIK